MPETRSQDRLRRAAIVAPIRTAVGKFGGALSSVGAGDLGAVVLKALIEPDRSEQLSHLEPRRAGDGTTRAFPPGKGRNVRRSGRRRAVSVEAEASGISRSTQQGPGTEGHFAWSAHSRRHREPARAHHAGDEEPRLAAVRLRRARMGGWIGKSARDSDLAAILSRRVSLPSRTMP